MLYYFERRTHKFELSSPVDNRPCLLSLWFAAHQYQRQLRHKLLVKLPDFLGARRYRLYLLSSGVKTLGSSLLFRFFVWKRWRQWWRSISRSSGKLKKKWIAGGRFKLECFRSTGMPRQSSSDFRYFLELACVGIIFPMELISFSGDSGQ